MDEADEANGGLRRRADWQGPVLAGFPAAPTQPKPPKQAAPEEEEEEEDDEDAGIPEPPYNAEDDGLFFTAVASFLSAILLAAVAPLNGKAVGLLGMACFLLGATVLIFSHNARGVLPLGVGVGVACGSLGLIFGGILQEALRYALVDLTGLRSVLWRA